jgi:transposase InsO family protein
MSMDITGPHPRSRDGHEYILTVMDSFTKWAEAIPIRAHTAPIVAKRLVDFVFSRYGTPLELLSDQGPEFESELMAELCRAYGIVKLRTTSYKASTNGMVERFHRTLNSMLGKVVSETQRDWDHHVAPVMAAYRATVHSSTGYTPNFLVYGRENRAPIDLVLAVEEEPKGVGESPNQYVNELVQRQRAAYRIVRQHLGRAAERRKREYDLRVRPRQFKTGDWVYYYYLRRYQGRSPEWARMYIGPYLVVRELPPCNYVLQKSARGKQLVTHADKLKLCQGETPPSWLSTGREAVAEGSRQDPEEEGDSGVDLGSPLRSKESPTARDSEVPTPLHPDESDRGPLGGFDHGPNPVRSEPAEPEGESPVDGGRVLRGREQRRPNPRYRDFV